LSGGDSTKTKFFTESNIKNWKKVNFFLEGQFYKYKIKTQKNKIIMACEEIFVNICKYAYKNTGQVEITLDFDDKTAKIEIADSGIAFDPLSFCADKEIDKDYKERKIGGMGIYMVKNTMDKLEYKRKDSKNYFLMFKNLC
jgi:anti-sigma regulatory factor (Ser/Thr protein kinase)